MSNNAIAHEKFLAFVAARKEHRKDRIIADTFARDRQYNIKNYESPFYAIWAGFLEDVIKAMGFQRSFVSQQISITVLLTKEAAEDVPNLVKAPMDPSGKVEIFKQMADITDIEQYEANDHTYYNEWPLSSNPDTSVSSTATVADNSTSRITDLAITSIHRSGTARLPIIIECKRDISTRVQNELIAQNLLASISFASVQVLEQV